MKLVDKGRQRSTDAHDVGNSAYICTLSDLVPMKHHYSMQRTLFFGIITVLALLFYLPLVLYAQWNNGLLPNSKSEQIHTFTDDEDNLSVFFDRSDCGLNYSMQSVKLTNRSDVTQAISQTFTINIPNNNSIEVIGAYLYWVVEGGNPNTNNELNLTTPIGSDRLYGQRIGRQSAGKCWGCDDYAAHHYKADISRLVCLTDPNGDYSISDFPTMWRACSPTFGTCICEKGDTDGATLLIIYKDHSASFNGHLRLWDGLIYAEQNQTLRSLYKDVNFCGQPTQTHVAFVLSDFQQFGNWQNNKLRLNNRNYPLTPRFYNQETITLPLTRTNEISAEFSTENGDCYSIIITAVYGRTDACPNRCTPNFNPPLPTVGQLPSLPFCAGSQPPTLNYTGFAGEVLKWQMTTDCERGPWIDITHTLPNYQPENLTQNTCFRVISKANACIQYSPTAQLTLTERIDAGTTLGGNSFCEKAENLRLGLSNRTGSVQYWQKATDPDCRTWENIAVTSSSLNVPLVEQTTCFRAGIKFSNCEIALSAPATVLINRMENTAHVTGTNAVCGENNTVILNLTNQNGAQVLNWESSTACDSLGTWERISQTTTTLSTTINANTCFRAVVKNGDCPQTPTSLNRVEITQATVAGNLSADVTVCSVQNEVNLHLVGYVGSIIRWETAPVGDDNNISSVIHTNDVFQLINVTQSLRFRAVVQAGNCTPETSNWITISYSDNLQPGSLTKNQSGCPNDPIQPLQLNNYRGTILRWEQSVGNDRGWVTAQITNQATFQPANINQNTWFRVVIGAEECGTIYSDTVKITLKSGANAGILTGATQACERLDQATLVLSAYLGTIKSWQKRVGNGGWLHISHTSATFTVANITQTTAYRVEVESSECGSVYSNVVTIRIEQPSIGGTLPTRVEACTENNSFELVLKDYQGSILQWERSSDSTNWLSVNYAGNNRLRLTNNDSERIYYRVKVQNGICEPQYSSVSEVMIRPPSVAGILSKDTTACADSITVQLLLKDYRGEILNWETSTDNGNSWQILPYNLPNLTKIVSQNSRFRVKVQNGSCEAVWSNPVSVTLLPPVKGGQLNGSGSICLGDNSPNLVLGNHAGRVIRWETSKNLGQTWYSLGKAGFTSYQPNRLTITTWFRAVLENGSCGTAYSTIGKIEVQQPSVAGFITGGGDFCNLTGQQLELKNHRGTVMYWESSTDNGITWQSINHTATIYPISRLTQSAWFRAVVMNGNCSAKTTPVVKVNLIQPSNGGKIIGTSYVCSGGTSGTLTLSNYKGRIVLWEVSTDNGVIWRSFNHSFDSFETDPIFGKTLVRALVQNESCSPAFSSVHTIDLVDRLVGGKLTADRPYCHVNDEIAISLTGYMGVISFWEQSQDNGQSFQTIANTQPTLRVTNLPQATTFRAKLVSGTCDHVYSLPITISLQSPPQIDYNSYIGCDGKGIIQALASGGSGKYLSYQLYKNGNLLTELRHPFQQFNNITVSNDYTLTLIDQNGCSATVSIAFPPERALPEIIDFPIITTGQIFVRWNSIYGQNVRYRVQYRVNGATNWTLSDYTGATTLLITNLQHNTEYQFQIIAECNGQETRSNILRFARTLSLGNCVTKNIPPPGGLYASFILPTSAQLNWNPFENGRNDQGYILSYGSAQTNPNNWTQQIVCHPTDRLIINNLTGNTVYRARIRANCSNCITALNMSDRRSDWSPKIEFKTPELRQDRPGLEDHTPPFNIFPNPATDQLFIQYVPTLERTSVEVFDTKGTLVHVITLASDRNESAVSVSNWTKGLYVFRFQTTNGVFHQKVIIE